MKNFIFILCCITFSSFAQNSNSGYAFEFETEGIRHFHSDIRIQSDCSVDITETITVFSRGISIQHGIYREIPLSYAFEGGETTVDFDLLHVKMNSKPIDYHTESVSNGIRIYIGSEDKILKDGFYTYEISYTTDWVLNTHHRAYDELYWNVNGTGWSFTADTVSAQVHFPGKAQLVQQKAYTGSAGSKANSYNFTRTNDGAYFQTTQPLAPYENLTIAVAWEKNNLVYPSGMRSFGHYLKSHALWFFCILAFIGLFLHNFRIWYKYGRDPKPGTIVPQYEAPAEFDPSEAAIVYSKGKNINAAFASGIISIATKGHIKIEMTESTGMFSKRTYTFVRTHARQNTKPLTASEQQLLELILENGDSFTFTEKSYSPRLKTARDSLHTFISKKHGDTYHLKRTVFKWRQYAYLFLLLIAAIIMNLVFGGNPMIIVLFFATSLIMNIVYGILYEQPTALGRQKRDELEGFKLYMQYADKERIRLTNPPDMNFSYFEKNLPYAIALGVADEWAGQFDIQELTTGMQSPYIWYHGASFQQFSSFSFSQFTHTISSASVPPSSSSGSSGGGFSGGGGGGGGGGGW